MARLNKQALKNWLDEAADRYNQPNFIADDPISIPHQFSLLQDREIIGLWTAILSWGQRKTIISKARELVGYMDEAPYDFVRGHKDTDLKRMLAFRHRTFNDVDLLYFMAFFKKHYADHDSLEQAFTREWAAGNETVEQALDGFHRYFFSLDFAPDRTRKHVSAPFRKSTCKRLNMFLRWMVRKDEQGVDFGIWHTIRPDQLVMPLDVHVERVGRRVGLITRKQRDWQTALELTQRLKQLDPIDPVRYDFALFGLGVLEKSPD
ncbi:MAG: TIGR02757 family protein [Saprospiraceae bacterium]|nr:TIGR02757 family protein [Saprospiraceae bacterium]